MGGPVELIQYLPAPSVTHGLDHRKSDVSDLRPSKGPELGNTRVPVVHLLRINLLRINAFSRKGWIAGSSPAMTAETEAPLFCIYSTEICFSLGMFFKRC
jgi:hypothetical protein